MGSLKKKPLKLITLPEMGKNGNKIPAVKPTFRQKAMWLLFKLQINCCLLNRNIINSKTRFACLQKSVWWHGQLIKKSALSLFNWTLFLNSHRHWSSCWKNASKRIIFSIILFFHSFFQILFKNQNCQRVTVLKNTNLF